MQNNERFAHQVQVSILFVETAINSDPCRLSKTYQSTTLGPSSD